MDRRAVERSVGMCWVDTATVYAVDLDDLFQRTPSLDVRWHSHSE